MTIKNERKINNGQELVDELLSLKSKGYDLKDVTFTMCVTNTYNEIYEIEDIEKDVTNVTYYLFPNTNKVEIYLS